MTECGGSGVVGGPWVSHWNGLTYYFYPTQPAGQPTACYGRVHVFLCQHCNFCQCGLARAIHVGGGVGAGGAANTGGGSSGTEANGVIVGTCGNPTCEECRR